MPIYNCPDICLYNFQCVSFKLWFDWDIDVSEILWIHKYEYSYLIVDICSQYNMAGTFTVKILSRIFLILF